jgi:hypothetical protein
MRRSGGNVAPCRSRCGLPRVRWSRAVAAGPWRGKPAAGDGG